MYAKHIWCGSKFAKLPQLDWFSKSQTKTQTGTTSYNKWSYPIQDISNAFITLVSTYAQKYTHYALKRFKVHLVLMSCILNFEMSIALWIILRYPCWGLWIDYFEVPLLRFANWLFWGTPVEVSSLNILRPPCWGLLLLTWPNYVIYSIYRVTFPN